MQMAEQHRVDRIVGIPSRCKAIRLEAPKSMQNRMPGASTRMHVLNRPPEPKESPQPTNVTLTAMNELPLVPTLKDPRPPELLPRALSQAKQLLQHLVCMLAQTRRRTPMAWRRVRHLDRCGDEVDLAFARQRVRHRDPHLTRLDLRIGEHLVQRVDRAASP
jgi:hypothetical protein